MSDYDDQEPHYAREIDELPEGERDPEIGPQEATLADVDQALGAVHLTAAIHGPEAAEAVAAERTFEAVDAAWERACERGWAAQADMSQEAGQ